MEFNDYQQETGKYAVYPGKGNNFVFPVLGLSGETGEVAEKIKKVLRDKDGKMDEESREGIKKEIGDVLWYLTQLATELDLSLDEVAKNNIEKIKSRRERGMTGGSGDNR